MKLSALALLAAFGLTLAAAPAMADDHEGKNPARHGPDKMFEKVDTDKDGAITKAESQAFHEEMFARKDLNKDGKLTKDEVKAAHEKMRAEREAKKAAAQETKK